MSATFTSDWIHVSATRRGEKNINRGLPCQDMARSDVEPRPYIIVCDGKGSSANSHYGADAVAAGTVVAIKKHEPTLAKLLDRECHEQHPALDTFFIALQEHWHAAIHFIAKKYSLKPADCETTINLAVAGAMNVLLIQVGDGAVIAWTKNKSMRVVTPEEQEFANCTDFIGAAPLPRKLIKTKFARVEGALGLAVMSDGVSPAMIRDKDNNAEPVAKLGAMLSDGRDVHRRLEEFLNTPQIWPPYMNDDRGLAMLIRRP